MQGDLLTRATADVLDEYGDRSQVCELELRSYGGLAAFSGLISTVRCHEDNVLLREHLGSGGAGRILVVDGGGSLRCALLGENVARLALENGWIGLVVNGCVRDSEALRLLPLGIHALGTNPRASGKLGGGEVDVQLAFGAVTFVPGKTLYVDTDGVVVTP